MEPNKHVDFEGEWGREYDEIIRMAIPGYDLLYELEEPFLTARLGKQADVLVAGAGSGKDLLCLAPQHPDWKITGVDPSPAMLKTCRTKIEANGLADRVTLFQGFVHELPEGAVFDAVICNHVLHVLPLAEKLPLLQSLYARVKPGGVLLFSTIFGEEGSQELEAFQLAQQVRFQRNGMTEKQFDVMLRVASQVTLIPEEQVIRLVEEAGFTGVRRVFTAYYAGAWIARKS
jgi:tRNA (cmo5U34)-methyltransferase